MRTKRLSQCGVLLAAVATTAASGCSSLNNTEKGVGIGGALGTGAGLAVGAATGNPKTGALVGGLLGAGVGGAVGAGEDRKDQEKRDLIQANAVANAQAVQQAQRLGLTDVIHMVQQGHDEQVIINQIRNSGSSFQLSANDLDFLKTNGVPPRVIAEMQNARPQSVLVRPARPVIIREQPEYIYAPPPPVVWFGGPRPYCYRHW